LRPAATPPRRCSAPAAGAVRCRTARTRSSQATILPSEPLSSTQSSGARLRTLPPRHRCRYRRRVAGAMLLDLGHPYRSLRRSTDHDPRAPRCTIDP
jgi:hypothetical protein